MNIYSKEIKMIKDILKRLTSLLLVAFMIIPIVPIANAMDESIIVAEPTKQVVPDVVYANGDDPLLGAATVTTGGDASLYVDINSTFTPSGYSTRTTGENAYTTAPGNDFSYHTSRNGSTSNSYVITPTNDLSWSTNSGSTGITGTLSDTAVSDYKDCGENGALCAKVNSKVLQIHALSDINVTFDFSSNLTIDKSDGQGNIMEGVYTLKTASDSPAIAQIKAGTARSNTAKTDLSKTVSATGSVSESIQQGEYLYVYFYGFFNNQSSSDVDTTKYTYTASVTNFEITPVTQSYSLTVGNSDCADHLVGGGKINVNGTAVTIPSAGTATGLTDALSGTSVVLSLNTVPSGYFHIGWRVDGTDCFQKTCEFTLDSNKTAYALLIPQVTVTMGSSGYTNASYSYKTYSGNTVNAADQYIARNSSATAYYKTLNEAFSANSVVVLLGNIVLDGDFTIPSGKTLSVQRDWTDPATSALQRLAESAGTSIFAKATINGTVTVQGNLVASGVQGTRDGVNGRATGGVGHLIINGTVNVTSGGAVCAYGMITGSGQINVASGGKVYELMEIRDMRSIYVMPDVVSGGAFPVNHYFVKTNEVTTTYSQGSNLIGCYCVSVSGQAGNGEAPIIGSYSSNASNQSLFMISSGSITKCFSSASPYNNKIIFRAENGSVIRTGKFSVTISGSTLDTSNFVLPLNYCYAIEIMNGGSMKLDYDYKLLPGALINVKEGGTLTIASGKKLILYRANDYGFPAMSGFSATAYPTAFTKPSGLSYPSNTAANVGSAKLNVDGTLNVEGELYVTNQLTNATSYSNGYNYLTGEGTINITGTLSNGTIKEWKQPDSQTANSVNVAYVPIKGNMDADATTDGGQTGYESLTKKTWYGHKNSSGVYYWDNTEQTTNTYTVIWKNEDGTVLETDENVPVGTIPTFDGETPSKEATVQNTYAFNGWSPAIGPVEGDQVYTATYKETVRKYRIVFWNEDGSEEFYNADYAYGVTPVCNGTPSKSPTAGYTYEFAGWASEAGGDVIDPLPTVEGDASYYAVFTATPIEYTVKWSINGVIQEETYTYNAIPEYKGSEPVKEADNTYRYTFAGWSKSSNGAVLDALDPVTKNVTYYAVFTKEKIEYTVAFVNHDGTELQSGTYSYNDQVYYVEPEPQRDGDAQYSYTFTGWSDGSNFYSKDGDLPRVTANTTYTAQFERTLNKYTVTWIGADGNTLKTEEVEYGTVPVYTGEEPAKQSDWQYDYVFDGWDPEIVSVTGDAVYTAKFKAVLRGNIVYGVRPVLDGILSLKFYIVPAESAKAAKLTYTYTYGSEEITKVEEFDLTDGSLFDNSTGCVVLRYTNIQSGCIARDVVLTIYDEHGEEQEILSRLDPTFRDTSYSYCVADWSRSIIAQYGDDESKKNTVELAKAIINYGYYSAEYFKLRFDGDYTNAESGFYGDLTESDISVLNAHAGIKDANSADVGLLGCRVILEGATTLRVYFKNPVESATVDGQACEVIPKDNMYYVELVNIASPNLDKTHTFKVSYNGSEYTFEYSVLSWVNSMISSSSTKQETYDLAKAIYLYWKAASAYFAQ